MSDSVKFVFKNQRRFVSKKAEIELFLIHVLAVRGGKMTLLGSLYLSAEEWRVMKNAVSSAAAFEIEE